MDLAETFSVRTKSGSPDDIGEALAICFTMQSTPHLHILDRHHGNLHKQERAHIEVLRRQKLANQWSKSEIEEIEKLFDPNYSVGNRNIGPFLVAFVAVFGDAGLDHWKRQILVTPNIVGLGDVIFKNTVIGVRKDGGRYEDGFVRDFQEKLREYGFTFERHVSKELNERLNRKAVSLTKDEWEQIPYSFLPKEKAALVKMQSGALAFTSKEIEELESLYGDFFDLNGKPRHETEVLNSCKLAV